MMTLTQSLPTPPKPYTKNPRKRKRRFVGWVCDDEIPKEDVQTQLRLSEKGRLFGNRSRRRENSLGEDSWSDVAYSTEQSPTSAVSYEKEDSIDICLISTPKKDKSCDVGGQTSTAITEKELTPRELLIRLRANDSSNTTINDAHDEKETLSRSQSDPPRDSAIGVMTHPTLAQTQKPSNLPDSPPMTPSLCSALDKTMGQLKRDKSPSSQPVIDRRTPDAMTPPTSVPTPTNTMFWETLSTKANTELPSDAAYHNESGSKSALESRAKPKTSRDKDHENPPITLTTSSNDEISHSVAHGGLANGIISEPQCILSTVKAIQQMRTSEQLPLQHHSPDDEPKRTAIPRSKSLPPNTPSATSTTAIAHQLSTPRLSQNIPRDAENPPANRSTTPKPTKPRIQVTAPKTTTPPTTLTKSKPSPFSLLTLAEEEGRESARSKSSKPRHSPPVPNSDPHPTANLRPPQHHQPHSPSNPEPSSNIPNEKDHAETDTIKSLFKHASRLQMKAWYARLEAERVAKEASEAWDFVRSVREREGEGGGLRS